MEGSGVNWRKASYSNGGANNCVEAADAPGRVLVRDTKQHGQADRIVVPFSATAWARFTAGLK